MSLSAQMPQWRRSARTVPVLGVLLVHAVLLLVWAGSVAPRFRHAAPPPDQRAPVVVHNVILLPVPQTTPATREQAAQQTQEQRPTPQQRSRSPRAHAQPTFNQAIVTTPSVSIAVTPAAITPETPTATPAEAAPSSPLNLTLPSARAATMKGRGALTEAQGNARQLALNDPRSNQRADPTQKLPDAVASAGKGDCVKGEYMGAGMGVLSAPFLALAAVTGHCKPLR